MGKRHESGYPQRSRPGERPKSRWQKFPVTCATGAIWPHLAAFDQTLKILGFPPKAAKGGQMAFPLVNSPIPPPFNAIHQQ
jgi:hypothetical protein